MLNGDTLARQKLIEGYLFEVRNIVIHSYTEMQTLELIYRCISELEKMVDYFNFIQDSEPFLHRLSLKLKQVVTGYIADM